ncbi:plasmid mobilization protein [Novosphingobium naphthalenivorans]|uniref:plasmid mobilization protein n=1 Tax=Novosphingobium naphthalenivorans TaxID=273168 RepID=UPI00082B85FA|nr:plasmid mobilization relaxosome protein MobC [Novosphingobium naphthalenivorans]
MARKPYDPPFSLRLSFEERARLTEQAEGQPLGAYIRQQLLDQPPRRKRLSQIDQDSLLRVLGQLGQSRIANNLNQLAKQANMGTLPVTPETEEALQEASKNIAEIRKLLIQALGLEVSP